MKPQFKKQVGRAPELILGMQEDFSLERTFIHPIWCECCPPFTHVWESCGSDLGGAWDRYRSLGLLSCAEVLGTGEMYLGVR